MNTAHLSAIDLNLLVVLDELLRVRSTTTAARRLGRTQSAVSHALGRLRELFRDPLLVRVGPALRPTALAEGLQEPLRALLGAAGALVAGTAVSFDPARVERAFTIAGTDFFEVVTLPRLLARIRPEAPGIELRTRFVGDDMERALLSREVDMAFGTRFRAQAGISAETIIEDDLVVVLRRDHPRARRKLTLASYCALDHVLITPRGLPGSVIDDVLEPLGARRRVVLRMPHFVAALHVVAAGDLASAVPRRFAEAMARTLPIALRELPFPSPIFSFAMAYATSHANDPAHTWLRTRIREAYLGEPRTKR